MNQCTGDCHTLLLPAAELRRKSIHTFDKADFLENLSRKVFCLLMRHSPDQQGYGDILGCGQRGKKIESLKDKAYRQVAFRSRKDLQA